MKSTTLCLFLVLLISFVNTATFNLQTTTTCTTTNANGVCTAWSQSGTIDEQTASCFAGQTLIKTQNGFKQMKDLVIGDFILTIQNSQQIWTQFKGWLHKNQQKIAEYLNVSFNNGWLLVSKKHNIALQNIKEQKYQFGFAQDLLTGKRTFNSNSNFVNITSQKGMYSPITSKFTYLVFPSENANPILAHNFANIKTPEFYEPIVKIILKTSEFLYQNVLDEDGIHVGAKWMMKNFQFLMK